MLDHFDTRTKLRITPPISGIVRFTDADYETYAANLGKAALWSSVPFNYLGT